MIAWALANTGTQANVASASVVILLFISVLLKDIQRLCESDSTPIGKCRRLSLVGYGFRFETGHRRSEMICASTHRLESITTAHNSRNAVVTGSRAARNAGKSPPMNPIASAHLRPFHTSAGDTLNAKTTWLKFWPSVDTV